MSRQWPDTVLIDIEERVAIAVVEIGDRLRGMDADGVVFRDYKPGAARPAAGADRHRHHRARRCARRPLVISALPESLTLIVDYVQVTTVDEISLVLKDGRQVVWGSADESETKAAGRSRTCSQTVDADVYDVSVPTQPTTRCRAAQTGSRRRVATDPGTAGSLLSWARTG